MGHHGRPILVLLAISTETGTLPFLHFRAVFSKAEPFNTSVFLRCKWVAMKRPRLRSVWGVGCLLFVGGSAAEATRRSWTQRQPFRWIVNNPSKLNFTSSPAMGVPSPRSKSSTVVPTRVPANSSSRVPTRWPTTRFGGSTSAPTGSTTRGLTLRPSMAPMALPTTHGTLTGPTETPSGLLRTSPMWPSPVPVHSPRRERSPITTRMLGIPTSTSPVTPAAVSMFPTRPAGSSSRKPVEENSNDATGRPSLGPSRTLSIPMAFSTDLQLVQYNFSGPQNIVETLEFAWQGYLTAILSRYYRDREGVQFTGVDLDVRQGRKRRFLWQSNIRPTRRLQELVGNATILSFEANGTAVLLVDASTRDANSIVSSTNSFLRTAVTMENLQQALVDVNENLVTVSSVSVPNATGVPEPDRDDGPTTVETVFGLFIAAAAMLGLAYTCRVICQNHKERQARAKKLMARPMVLPNAPPSLAYQPRPMPRQTLVTPNQSGNNDDTLSIPGIPSTETSDGDRFARELQEAASLDRAVWEERQYDNSNGVTAPFTRVPESTGKLRVSSSFPYGDEAVGDFESVVHQQGGFELTPQVGMLGSNARSAPPMNGDDILDVPDFEAFGDTNTGPELRQFSVSDRMLSEGNQKTRGSQMFSFTDRPGDATVGDSTITSRDPSLTAIPESPSLSSWSPKDNEDDEDTNVSDIPHTNAMLQEVERLSMFVRQYEKEKEARKSSQFLVDTSGTGNAPVRRTQTRAFTEIESLKDVSFSPGDEDSKRRLGIGQYSVQEKIPGPLVDDDGEPRGTLETANALQYPSLAAATLGNTGTPLEHRDGSIEKGSLPGLRTAVQQERRFGLPRPNVRSRSGRFSTDRTGRTQAEKRPSP